MTKKEENLKYLLSLALDELHFIAKSGLMSDDETDRIFNLIDKIKGGKNEN